MDRLLVTPSLDHLPAYADALERGWSPDNVGGRKTAEAQLARIAEDAAGFVASLTDLEAKGAPITLPDGSVVPRLPGFVRWMWADGFAGSIGFRWRPGGATLPTHVLGHIGYAVVPWREGRGYATRALREMLDSAREYGLPYVELTTLPDNIPSQRVIEKCGGVMVERFEKAAAYGGGETLRYRIELSAAAQRQ